MVSDQGDAVSDFENALRRLGWLSAYARQALISRHLLRNLETISEPNEILPSVPGEFALDCFRVVITVLTGVNQTNRKFSSPYEPLDRPETHYLAFNRKQRIFSTSIASGMPEIAFFYGEGNSFSFENSEGATETDRLFAHEVFETAKDTTLSTKEIADARVDKLRNRKLWRGLASEREILGKEFFDNWYEWAGEVGAFWREWYQGFLDGKPLDWELQRRVALIADEIWEAGPEAVAKEIERIRREYERDVQGEDIRHAKFEPQSVEKLYANRAIVTANISQVSYDITDAIGRFHSETGFNKLPDQFLPLQAIPRSLTRIGAILRREHGSTETEQQLREEIGRLNAKIAQLEKELEAARQSPEPIVAPEFKKQLGTSLGDWKLYAALCGGLWLISGDQIGMQARLENILMLRETLFGEDCPAPTDIPQSESIIET